MDKDRNSEGNNNIEELVKRFEQMLQLNEVYYFESDELEEIIDHYFNSGNPANLKKVIDFALERYPFSADFKIARAQFLAYNQQTQEALKLLNDVELVEPSNPDIYTTRGYIYSQMGLSEQAVENYKTALKYTDQPDEVMIALGTEFLSQEKYLDAIYYLKKAVMHNPDNDYALSELFIGLDAASQLDEGRAFFQSLIDENPYNHFAWFNLGLCCSKLGDHEKALEAYEYAIAINEKFASAYFNKANALASLNRFNEAIDVYKETFGHEDPDPTAYYYIGECYEQMHDYDSALLYYNKCIKKQPEFADAWLAIGVVLDMQNRLTEGIHYLKKAIELNGKDPEYWYVFGDVQRKLGFFEEAADAYAHVIELHYPEWDIWMDYADLLFEADYAQQGLEMLQEALKQFPEVAEIHYRMSAMLLGMGKKQEALVHLQSALTLDYDKHNELFEYAPALKENKTVLQVIDTFKKP
ncbi:MAG TPA: tetratricopeptide repeat protein [Bacteroidia bacterium]|nr:tetratricopeptide repeat protein [Bacteroidia bacterium]